MKTKTLLKKSQQGSVLIVALIFSALIAIALGSYLSLGSSAMQLSHRSLYNNAAMNLAETGLEEAMWSINQVLEGNNTAWAGWDDVGGNEETKRKPFGDFLLEQGVTGSVVVYVENAPTDDTVEPGSAAPIIYTRATVTLPRGQPIQKWIMVELTRRSLFANGLLAKNSIKFSGNGATVDSYDSTKGPYNALLPDGTYNRFAEGPAASMSVAADTFNLGNADIYGYVSVGTTTVDAGLDVGPNGTVSGDLTETGSIDYDRTTPNFTANLDDPKVPDASTYNSNIHIPQIGPMMLPRPTDVATTTTLGDGTTYTEYYISATSISLSGNVGDFLEIETGKNVVIVLTATTGSAISVSGNSSIQVKAAATLNIYTQGDVSIAGNGVSNDPTNPPQNFMLWGTKPAAADGSPTQSISISGNGQLSAVVYAPNAAVTAKGGGTGGQILGAIVGNTIEITGGSKFHYDQSLAELNDDQPFGISNWNELTAAADRNAVASKLN